jgi:mannosyltransferase
MAKKRKYPQKMVVKLPETNKLDQEYINPIKSSKDYTIENIKYVLLNNRYMQLLIIITCIGFFLRFYNLGFNSLWLDEASTLNFATIDGTGGSFLDIWTYALQFDPNPPIFVWMEYIIITIAGISEITLRFLPALFGAITVPIMYFVGKEFIDENGGIITATAFALSPFLILYSQEARSYSTLLFFIALATLFYLKSIKSENLKYWIIFALIGSFAIWIHFYAIIFLGALIIYTLLMYKMKYIKNLIISTSLIIITTIPVIIITLQTVLKHVSRGSTFGDQGVTLIYDTVLQISGYNIVSMYILLLLFICGIFALYIKERDKTILLLWILVFTFGVSVILSYKLSMVPRYLSFLSIILFLGVAASYKLLYALTHNKIIIYSLIIMLVAINTPFLMTYYSEYSKPDYRGFSKTLSSVTQPGDLVVTVPEYMYQPINYYYSNKTDGTLEYRASNESSLIRIRSLQTKNTYYIVTADIQSADPSGNALKWLQLNTQQTYQSNGIFVFKS